MLGWRLRERFFGVGHELLSAVLETVERGFLRDAIRDV